MNNSLHLAVIFIGGPFLLLWLIERLVTIKGKPVKFTARKIPYILLIIAALPIIVLTCAWVSVAQPTIGKFDVVTIGVVIAIVGLLVLTIWEYGAFFVGTLTFVSITLKKRKNR